MDGLFEPSHIIFILVIVLIIFGPGKLPQLGRGLGDGIRGFKEAIKGARGVEKTDASEQRNTPVS
ncbi:MAG: twin-arginine translocase TatA/TatE family subunit [Terriglobia bacterium]